MNKIYVKAYPKINISLKIFPKQANGLHPLESRFALVMGDLYDEMSFIKLDSKNGLILNGNFNCDIESNLIFKAYNLLLDSKKDSKNSPFTIQINVNKKIKVGGGLGGGSCNAAITLLVLNEMLELHFDKRKLLNMALKLGSDVPFFLMIYSQNGNKIEETFRSFESSMQDSIESIKNSRLFLSANVRGFGEIIEPFYEPFLSFNIYTNDIFCNTGSVYKEFDRLLDSKNIESTIDLTLDSKKILTSFNIYELNDLYFPATLLYKELLEIQKSLQDSTKQNIYFSGSGSSFFSLN